MTTWIEQQRDGTTEDTRPGRAINGPRARLAAPSRGGVASRPLSEAQLDRARGVLLGAAVGDALGAGYEFGAVRLEPGERPAMIGGGLGDFAPGEWTDDTAMSWAVADVAATGADLRADEALDAIVLRFREWYDGRPADIGTNTLMVLTAAGPHPTGAALTAAALAREKATGRAGSNGSLMRTSPVALAHLDDPDALVEAAMAVSALTHPDQNAVEACALWCLAIRHAVLTGELDLRAGVSRLAVASQDVWHERIEAAETHDPSTFSPNGWVVTALQAAWSSIVQTPRSIAGTHFADVLETAIRIGHNTDTVASTTGALLGRPLGEQRDPRRVATGRARLPRHHWASAGGARSNDGRAARYALTTPAAVRSPRLAAHPDRCRFNILAASSARYLTSVATSSPSTMNSKAPSSV